MATSLSEQLEERRAGWSQRVPEARRAKMERHIKFLSETKAAQRAKQIGDIAPAIILPNAHGGMFDVRTLFANGPVVVAFYRGGWCPFCNLELKAYQDVLPRIVAAHASLVAISPEKPDDTVSTTDKNGLGFPVLSDIGQRVGRAFGVIYDFTDELRSVYADFGHDIPAKNGTPDDWALPMTATYVIDPKGVIIYADIGVDYRHRTDPHDVLAILERLMIAG